MFGGDVRVSQLFGFRLGAVEHALHFAAEAGLGSAAGLGRESGDLLLHRLGNRSDVESGFLKQGLDHAFVLRQQGGQQVRIVHDRIASRPRELSGVPKRLLGLDRQSLWSNHSHPRNATYSEPPIRRLRIHENLRIGPRDWQGLYRRNSAGLAERKQVREGVGIKW